MNDKMIMLAVFFAVATQLMLPTPVATAAERIAFVTSVTGNGNLGTWPDAGGNNGLDAADAICVARATAAGLANPGDFVAWLSDSQDDAYCRVHGFTGTKAGMCGGQPSLPEDAGPWVRVDGYAFAPKLVDALGTDGVIYGPVTFDEWGTPLATNLIFTETAADGTYYSSSASAACGDWLSSAALSVLIGDTTGGTVSWTASGTTICSSLISLMCMQTGPGDPLPPVWRQGAKVFATSVTGDGNLNTWPDASGTTGIAAGNTICQKRAELAGLSEKTSYRAWLSDSTNDAKDQLLLDGPWTRLDGVPVAGSLAELIDGQLDAPINVTEDSTYLGNVGVWTGTTAAGVAGTDHCDGWTDGTGSSDGVSGSAYRSTSTWTQFGNPNLCTPYWRIYCFSNMVTDVFVDGFESSNTNAWSTTVP